MKTKRLRPGIPLCFLILLSLSGFWAAALSAQLSDSTTIRYRGAPILLPPLVLPAALQPPWVRPIGLFPNRNLRSFRPAQAGLADATGTSFTFSPSDSAARARLMRRLGYEEGRRGEATEVRNALGLSPRTADLTLDGQVQVAISSSRQRALNCTPMMLNDPYSGCRGGFTAPKVENVVILQSRGVFGQRLHVDLDLNTARSYQSNNIARIYFQGLEDEVVQRVEAGNVQFQAPSSRYLSASIPVNNRGLSSEFQLGPVNLKAIVARQEGSSTEERIITIGDISTQKQDRKVADLDFENGRFFWIVDPTTLSGYPHLDILSLENLVVPESVRPAEIQLYRYVAANQPGTAGATYDGIMALGINGNEKAGPLRWRLLHQNVDYWVDPSGLWLVLAGAIDPNDFLAVSYRTRSGEMVGTMPVTDNPERADTVRLIALPNRGTGSPVFPHAMRQVYRVAGDLVSGTLRVGIEVAQSERPVSGKGTYLSELGLAIPADEAIFDIDNRLFPRSRDPGASQVVRDRLIIFPNAEPFADSTVLTSAERNDSLYRTPEYLLYSQGPPVRFQIRLSYDATSSGDRSGFYLGEIRDESERIAVGGRVLQRGLDYRVEYQTGQVTFLDPKALFPETGGLTFNVSYERQAIFAIAPTSIGGLTASLALGRSGTLSLVSLYQREQSAYRRPPIGSEPKAGFLGGVISNFNFQLPGVTEFLKKISRPSANGAPSSLLFNAEFALTKPDPNRYGEAFLEEFEDDGGTTVPLGEQFWRPGSAPQRADGVDLPGFGAGFLLDDAVQLTWQNLVAYGSGFYEVFTRDIDSTIRLTDTRDEAPETVLWTTFHADTAGGMVDSMRRSHWTLPKRPGRPRWRSITTPLSTTGVDFTRNEYLEFWLYQTGDTLIQKNQMRLVLDLGKVSEDAIALAPTHFTVQGNDTTWTGRQLVGLGHLDTERSALGTWNAVTDDKGILGARADLAGPEGLLANMSLCRMQQTRALVAFPFGDLDARCTRGNGLMDTEDLDNDGVLDALGPDDDVQRYVVDLHDPRYFVRNREVKLNDQGGKAYWTLYRVPLRTPDVVIGQPDPRLVKQMRITFVTPPDPSGAVPETIRFGLARMRFTGAPWIRRSDGPILGLSGTSAESHGSVAVGTVSTQNIELGYQPPPGLGNSLNEINSGIGAAPIQINEKSLRIIASDLRGGERAEAYHRLGSGGQNLLAYRQLRVWMRGRGPGWASGDLQGYIKVGSDVNNYYLYRVTPSELSWEPDVVIDLERWRELRADIEVRFQQGESPDGGDACGADPTAWVACDGPYLVQVRDPQINPPNLASVQEVAVGIWRPETGSMIDETELWVDDIRLREPVGESGAASAVGGRFVGSDLFTLDFDWSRRDGRFHQISENPSYRTVTATRIGGSVQLHRILPTWGFDIPVTFSTNGTSYNPQILSGTDIRGSALEGLRPTDASGSNWTISLRRRAGYSTSALMKFLVDPLSLLASGASSSNRAELSESHSSSYSVSLNWNRSAPRRGYGLGLSPLMGNLPDWLGRSAAGQGISRGTFALLPTTLRFNSSLSRNMGDYLSFRTPIERLSDTILRPVTSLQHTWSNGAGLSWQPIGMISLTGDWRSTRDLRHYPDSTTLGRLAEAGRKTFLGGDVGVERDRNVTASLSISPAINNWLRPQLTGSSNFFLSRSLTSRNPVRLLGDSAGGYILPQTLNNSRSERFSLDLDPLNLARGIWGDSGAVITQLSRLRPITLVRTHTLLSTYDLAAFSPDLSYHLGLGGLGEFMRHQGGTAISAGEMWSSEVIADLDLPANLTLNLRYTSSESERYQGLSSGSFLRTEARQSTPSGDLRWGSRVSFGPLIMIQTGAHYERKYTEANTPTITGVSTLATTESRAFRPNLSLTFSNQMSLDLSTTQDRSSTLSGGNITRGEGGLYSVIFNASFRMPRKISRLRRSMQTSLEMNTRNDRSCLQRSADTACVTYSDLQYMSVRSNISGVLGSGNQRLGAQGEWALEDNRSLRRKMTRLSLRVYFSFPLSFLAD